MVGSTGNSGVHLSREMILSLQEQKRRDRAEIERLEQNEADTDRKLDAIRVLAPELFSAPEANQHDLPEIEPPAAAKSFSLVEAVTKAVERSRRHLVPAAIRKAIEDQGDGHLLTSQNYLYTAIKRATDQQKIKKFRNGYGRMQSPPEAEASGLPL